MRREPMVEPAETEELFVAFANTLSHTRGTAHDDIPDAEALLDWLRAHDLVSSRGRATEAARLRRDPDEAERRLERFRHLRGLLHDTAWSISRDGLARPRAAHRAESRPAPWAALPPAANRAGRQPLRGLAGRRPIGPGPRGHCILVRALRGRRRPGSAPRLRQRRLSRRLRRPLPRREAALVRHADLRQPGQGGAASRACPRAGGRGSLRRPSRTRISAAHRHPPVRHAQNPQRGEREPTWTQAQVNARARGCGAR